MSDRTSSRCGPSPKTSRRSSGARACTIGERVARAPGRASRGCGGPRTRRVSPAGSGAAASGSGMNRRQHLDLAAHAFVAQPRRGHPRERERALRHAQAELLHGPADPPAGRAEVIAPVLARPQLEPVDDELVAVQRPRDRGGEQREVRKRRGVDDVVAPSERQQVPQHARPEHERWRDPAAAVDVELQARPGDPHGDALDRAAPAAIPLAQRQVRHLVAVGGEPLGERAIPALAPADRVRVQAVVDDEDPHRGAQRVRRAARHAPRRHGSARRV